jgi:hypothetical protein
MVLTQGFINNMRSMITGWYRDKIPGTEEPPWPASERRPDIARALKEENASSQTNVPAPPAATTVEVEKAQAVPIVSPEAPASASSTEKEGEKDGEPKS